MPSPQSVALVSNVLVRGGGGVADPAHVGRVAAAKVVVVVVRVVAVVVVAGHASVVRGRGVPPFVPPFRKIALVQIALESNLLTTA